MANLILIIAPDPRLAMRSEPIDKVTDETRKLVDDMIDTMHEEDGIGLAAVQVGVLKRVLVMDLSGMSDRYEASDEDKCGADISKPMCMINPEIIKESAEQNSYDEGCLSFPGQRAMVTRPKKVTIKYLDYKGKEQTMACDDLLSTCVQHEIDHLNGVVFVDHVSKMKRDMVIKKVQKIKKRFLSSK